LPSVQEELLGFRLTRELGRGAFARVFLAEQADLAGRPVVLKVSEIAGREPQTLAQLQHTHIVPIYSLHDDEHTGLRAVCMPYFGGAPLSKVLDALWGGSAAPTRGEQLAQALDVVQAPAAPTGLVEDRFPGDDTANQPAGPTPRAVLAGLSYVRAAAWIAARLAEGLQHAHQRGVFHRDIKPSNILLGADGQPMLLDFNLAHNLRDCQTPAALGGTVAYMAPEHLRALTTTNLALIRLVDQRADIYSLGMVLHEMLLGRSPFAQEARYSPLHERVVQMACERSQGLPTRPCLGAAIPWSLESIVRKCLAPDPARPSATSRQKSWPRTYAGSCTICRCGTLRN
jgi:serine/threonine protein kinase